MITQDVIIAHPGGVHALVAQELATLANSFASSLVLRHDGRTASAGKVISVLALNIRQGACVTVLADGLDESPALAAVIDYLAGPTPDKPNIPQTDTNNLIATENSE